MPSKSQSAHTSVRAVLVTNIPSPYRIPFLEELSSHFDLHVVFDARTEGNRHWHVPESLPIQHSYARGYTFSYTRRRNDGFPPEQRELHLRYGVLTELIRLKPDVVLSQELGFRSGVAMIYCLLRHVPLILWSEGTPHTEGWVGLPKRMLRQLLSRSARRHWVNGVESAELIREYAPNASIDEGMTGVDTCWFASGVRTLLAQRNEMRSERNVRDTCFLFVGQLVNRKGVTQMLGAIATVAGQHTNFTVLLAGEGPLRDEISVWQQNHPDCDVRLMGHQSPEELRKLYAIADVFLLPTLDDNWALATLEGAVAGLPQIFSKYNGATAELTAQGVTGEVVDPLRPEEFAAAMLSFAEDRPARLAREVVDAVVAYYSPREFAGRAALSMKKALGSLSR
jgi:glycosyltransferase involved in cell wall biosynthesis